MKGKILQAPVLLGHHWRFGLRGLRAPRDAQYGKKSEEGEWMNAIKLSRKYKGDWKLDSERIVKTQVESSISALISDWTKSGSLKPPLALFFSFSDGLASGSHLGATTQRYHDSSGEPESE